MYIIQMYSVDPGVLIMSYAHDSVPGKAALGCKATHDVDTVNRIMYTLIKTKQTI